MAIAVTARHTGNSGTTSVATLATNSTTPSANSRLFAFCGVTGDAHATAPTWQTPTGGSLTYTQVAQSTEFLGYLGDGAFPIGASLWRADVGGSPSAHTVTFDAYSSTIAGYTAAVCCDVTGANSTIVQTKLAADDTASNAAVTLDATPTSGNTLLLFCWASADAGGGFGTPAAGSGKNLSTVTAQDAGYTQAGIWQRTCDGSESTTVTLADIGDSAGGWVMIAVELAPTGGSTNGDVTAVAATATALAVPPTVTATRNATVTAVPATATAQAGIPAVSAGGNATVAAVTATATALAAPPVVTAGATVSAVTATATASAEAPTVGGEGAVSGGGPATATAQAHAPTVTATRSATVTAVPATATAAAGVPSVAAGGEGTVIAVAATATATAHAPTVDATRSVTVDAVTATAIAQAIAPTIDATRSVTVQAVAATATATARAPIVGIGAPYTPARRPVAVTVAQASTATTIPHASTATTLED